MKGIKQKFAGVLGVLVLVVVIGALVGFFKGSEAKQKWVFKMKDKYDTRRQIAEQKSIARRGGVLLDDIELASYHN